MEGRAVSVQQDSLALRIPQDHLAVRGVVLAERDGELRPFTAGGLEGDYLPEPRFTRAFEHDVAARLDREPVQRGLKREPPAVDRGRERVDRPLELGAEIPVLGEPAVDPAHATSRHSSTATSMPAAPSSNSTVQASSITL